MPTSEQIEKAAFAIMIEDECGLMVNGKRVLCDDASCGDDVELKCVCRNQAHVALTAAEGVKPRVKPLEWTPMPEDRAGKDSYEAETPFGTSYTCTTTPKLYGWSVDHGLSVIHDTDDLSEAKAAAQADYEARIRSALQEGE